MNPSDRERIIVRTSVIGIVANVLLVAFKATVGLAANSIAIVLDAVNNLTDALSSVITILGAKLAGKGPNRAHPLGYGRYEYLSALVIVAIVLYAGITSLVESIRKIIEAKRVSFDVIINFTVSDRESLYRQIVNEVQALYPGYAFAITLDRDLSD